MRAVVSLFLFGSSVVTGASTSSGQDTWFCIISGFLLSIPLMLVQAGILDLYPGRNYYDNVLEVYGKIGGRVVVLILSLYALLLGGLVLRVYSEFIRIVNLTATPLPAVIAFILGVSVYLLENRVFVLARIAKFVLPIIAVSISITVLLSFKDMDFGNIQPMLHSGFSKISQGTLLSLTLPFGEIVACAPVFEGLERRQKVFPVFLRGALSGFLVMLAANLRNLLVLGYSAQVFPFASYESVSVISYGEFFTRIEVLIGINLLLAGFVKVCVLIFSTASGFTKIFGLEDYVPLIAPCGLLLFMVTLAVHTNTDEMFGWLKYLPFFSIPFQVILPVLTLVVGVIRKKVKGKGKGKRAPAKKEAKDGQTVPEP